MGHQAGDLPLPPRAPSRGIWKKCLGIAGASALLIMGGLYLGFSRTDPAKPDRPEGPAWFEDVTARSGLTFIHDCGPLATYFMPQSIGSGAALFDYDGDGRLDIYLVHNGGPNGARNQLFHQRPDGTFEDVSAGSGLDVAGYGMGVAVGDVNNDGRPDVLVTEYGRARLFVNRGGGSFAELGPADGIDNVHWGTSAAFLDYDRDGLLDLVIVNYVDYLPSRGCNDQTGKPDYCHPYAFGGTVARLYHNESRAGCKPEEVRFRDVTAASGLAGKKGNGLGVFCADFNADGWPDIFVANDGMANHLWVNRKDGTFADEAVQRGLAFNGMGQAQANMGIAFGDVAGRGRFDLFVTHLNEERHALWCQDGLGLFQDRTTASGLAAGRWHGTGWGTVLADFDNDGALDLALVNGGIYRDTPADDWEGDPFWRPYAQRNQLFAGTGTGQFRDVSPQNPALCGRSGNGRGLACGDLDGDGGLDLLVTNVGGPARLYRNVAPRRGHWLLVRAVEPLLRRDAYGAEITASVGGHRLLGWVNPGGSYLCSSDPRVHFGLGPADRVDGLHVRWPDGTEEDFPGAAADRPLVLHKGEGRHEHPGNSR